MQQFYADTNVFITGGTGFLGKTLIHKILTTCESVNAVYLLVRPKKGQNGQERVAQIFNGTIFNSAKYRHKIHCIVGDSMLPDLGINEADKSLLVQKINIVFHMAATVKFDEPLRVAALINVRATRDLLQLCREMQHLRCLMHVSTLFAQCPFELIEERFYEPPMDVDRFLEMVSWVPDQVLTKVTPLLLDDRPNTYTYTKAIAEGVLERYGHGMPVAMFRPAIVISTCQGPQAGWIDNYYGPTGTVAGYLAGIIRSMPSQPSKMASLVPVDMCVNGLLACAWDAAKRYQAGEVAADPPVYNFSTTRTNSMTWGAFADITHKNGELYPTVKSLWYPGFSVNPNPFLHWLYIWLLHYFPAALIDAATWIVGKKPFLIRQYRKTNQYIEICRYFSSRHFECRLDRLKSVWESMTSDDRELFNFNINTLNWKTYMNDYMRGVRVYLLKDPMETLPAAKKQFKRQFWMHQLLKAAVFMLLLFSFSCLIKVFKA